jgi:hypothetical protein
MKGKSVENLPSRNKLRTVMDNAAFAISGNPAEHTLYPHTNLHFVRTADNLGSHTGPLIQFYYGENIGGKRFELFICRMNNGIGNNFTVPGKLVIHNPAIPAAVRTE